MEVKQSRGAQAVDLNTVKNYIRTNYTVDDSLLDDILIKSAQSFIEKQLEICLTQRTVTAFYECANSRIELPFGPHISVDAVYFVDKGVETATDNWYTTGLDYKTLYIGESWTSGGKLQRDVKVVMTCGFVTDESDAQQDIPEQLIEALLKVIATNYEMRMNYGESPTFVIPNEAKQLMKPYKRYHW
jgi:uncharacterized phiE125 gp8 family phage protein